MDSLAAGVGKVLEEVKRQAFPDTSPKPSLRTGALPDYHLPVTASLQKDDPWVRGVYLIPDAAQILRLPAGSLRSWVGGRNLKESLHFPAGEMESEGSGRDRHFGFLTLVELYIVAQLRTRGLSMATIRIARDELSVRYSTDHPFALGGLLCSGKGLLHEMGDGVLLELGTRGQTAFEKVLQPFCDSLDFDAASSLARRFFPLGKERPIVVDPRHGFGRPTIEGTNITTAAIMALLRGGETVEDVSDSMDLAEDAVKAARNFESNKAA